MCGICGEWRFKGQTSDAQINAMLAEIERRGPDDVGIHRRDGLTFGHRRLSIIDLSEGGHQPMNAQSEMMVFNGCIYNYRELMDELKALGQTFNSHSDSEVILRAYQQWGKACVERLDGMFAFAIWDADKNELFLARDRLGIKPLYYAEVDGAFRFASNMQSILAGGGVDKSIDPVALHHQFTLHAVIPAPRTILQGIRKVAPGTTLTITAQGEIQENTYWTLKAERPAEPLSDEEWIARNREALKKAVKKRLLASDVPVGVLLSGGLDSSLLVGLLAEVQNDLGIEHPLHTFSIGFEDIGEEYGSEFFYSDQVVEQYQTEHHKYHIPNEDVLKRLPEAVACMAEPMFGQDAVAFYLLSEQVAQDVKVVMSGQGADEVYGGYFWYPQMKAAAEQHPEKSAVENFAPFYFDRDHAEWLEMIAPEFHVDDVTTQWASERLNAPGADEHLDKVLRLDVTALITDDPVKRVDNMTMAWGLEARVPFLDAELVELAMQIPPSLKMQEGGKYPLKAISRGLIPDAVIDRPKGYFPMPALKYVRGEFFDFMEGLLNSEACIKRGLYQREYVEKILAAPEDHHTRLQGSKLWHMALLEFWLQTNVDVW